MLKDEKMSIFVFLSLLIDDNDASKASEGNVTVLYPEINV